MKTVVLFLFAALVTLAADEWRTGKVTAVDLEQQAPVGDYPGLKKGIRYAITASDGEYIAYEVSATVFSDFRPKRAQVGDEIRFSVRKNRLTIEAAGKAHKLWLQRGPDTQK